MKKIKTIVEIIILLGIIVIALWFGAFLLKDKNEFFCKLSFGEYKVMPTKGYHIEGYRSTHKCVGSFIVNIYNKY